MKIAKITISVLLFLGLGRIALSGEQAVSKAKRKQFYDAAVFGEVNKVTAMFKATPALINAKDEYGFTALHGVAGEEQYKMAELLIAKGAKVNAENNEGITPLHLAAYPKMVKLLVKHGAKLDHRAKDGSTPLHTQAAEAEGKDCIAALLGLGADPSIKNDRGETPADIASARDEYEKVKLLQRPKRKGANKNSEPDGSR